MQPVACNNSCIKLCSDDNDYNDIGYRLVFLRPVGGAKNLKLEGKGGKDQGTEGAIIFFVCGPNINLIQLLCA